MAATDKTVQVYQELAEYYDRQKQAPVRDRFLVLAADAAQTAGRQEEAEQLRGRLLHLNPHHLLKPFSSLAEATRSPDVQNYIAGLRRTYPPETCERQLESLRAGNTGAAAPARAGAGETQDVRPTAEAYRLEGEAADSKQPSAGSAAPSSKAADPWSGIPGVVASRSASPVPARTANRPSAGREPTRPARSEVAPPQKAPLAWVSMGLFWLVLAAGLALAIYTAVKPFLAG